MDTRQFWAYVWTYWQHADERAARKKKRRKDARGENTSAAIVEIAKAAEGEKHAADLGYEQDQRAAWVRRGGLLAIAPSLTTADKMFDAAKPFARHTDAFGRTTIIQKLVEEPDLFHRTLSSSQRVTIQTVFGVDDSALRFQGIVVVGYDADVVWVGIVDDPQVLDLEPKSRAALLQGHVRRFPEHVKPFTWTATDVTSARFRFLNEDQTTKDISVGLSYEFRGHGDQFNTVAKGIVRGTAYAYGAQTITPLHDHVDVVSNVRLVDEAPLFIWYGGVSGADRQAWTLFGEFEAIRRYIPANSTVVVITNVDWNAVLPVLLRISLSTGVRWYIGTTEILAHYWSGLPFVIAGYARRPTHLPAWESYRLPVIFDAIVTPLRAASDESLAAQIALLIIATWFNKLACRLPIRLLKQCFDDLHDRRYFDDALTQLRQQSYLLTDEDNQVIPTLWPWYEGYDYKRRRLEPTLGQSVVKWIVEHKTEVQNAIASGTEFMSRLRDDTGTEEGFRFLEAYYYVWWIAKLL